MAKLDTWGVAEVAYAGGFKTVEKNRIATSIAMAESGGVTDAVGDGGSSYGLWQIHLPAHPDVTRFCAVEAICAARAAYKISGNGSNWQPWTVYKTGAYQRHMGAATTAARVVVQNGGRAPQNRSIIDSIVGGVTGAIGDAAGAANPFDDIANFFKAMIDILDPFADFFKALTDIDTYKRVGYFIGGVIAVALAYQIISKETGVKIPGADTAKAMAGVAVTKGVKK